MEFFGAVKTACGLQTLNDYLQDRSYICGHTPSEVDVEVFSALAKAPEEKFLHALRWYNHIKSLGIEFKLTLEESLSYDTVLPKNLENECQVTTNGTEPLMEAKTAVGAKNEELKCGNDDGCDSFGSDDKELDRAAAKFQEERLQAYAEKKATNPVPITKSSLTLSLKPWDDSVIHLMAMEEHVRLIKMDGLEWGASKLDRQICGTNKITIECTIEDEKVSVDDLVDKIYGNHTTVHRLEIVAVNKI